MRVIKPATITDATFTSSDIPEPDATQGEVVWTAGTYTLGDQRLVISTHTIYQVVVASTTDEPTAGAALTVPSWVVLKPSNKWAMFDNVNGTQSIYPSDLTIELTQGVINNSLASFNVTGASSVDITVTDPTEGVVYTKTVEMLNNEAVVDYYEYFFSPLIPLTEFALTDLPAYSAATIKVDYIGDAGINVGTLIVGNAAVLGVANHGTSLQLLDFSVKDTDEFGNFIITPRRNSKLVDFDCTVLTSRVSYVFNTLSSLTTTPAVWLGTESTSDATLVYGYYRDSQINISGPIISDCTIQIEGLT
tara:strand:- start:2546 stop:3460 length:915 start_codon:yes stop_codon:yes gene_type:complete